jgi:hypothetical protein
LSLLSNGSCENPSLQSMASSFFINQWESRTISPSNGIYDENSCAQWNTKKFPSSNQNKMIIFMTPGIGGHVFFHTLDILMRFLSSIIANFVWLISALFFHPNYFK